MSNILFSRTEILIGSEAMIKLQNAKVAVIGIGGVGSAAAEALARSGVGRITVIDNDIISQTNLNRQLIALHSTIGQVKVHAMRDRIIDINPICEIEALQTFIDKENIPILIKNFDYIVDAIDTVTSKLDLAEYCFVNEIKLISSLGTGNKLDPTMFKIADINETSVCPLARVMRRELKKRGVAKLKVLFSEEIPKRVLVEDLNGSRHTPASISFVPPAAGMIIAGAVIKDLISE